MVSRRGVFRLAGARRAAASTLPAARQARARWPKVAGSPSVKLVQPGINRERSIISLDRREEHHGRTTRAAGHGPTRQDERGYTLKTRVMKSRNSPMKLRRNFSVDSTLTSPFSEIRLGVKWI